MTNEPIDYDHDLFRDIQAHAQELKSLHSQRDIDFQRYKEAYLLEWPVEKVRKVKRLKQNPTMSPDARIDVKGAISLLISTDPQFNISNMTGKDKLTGNLENSLLRIFEQNGRILGIPLHHDMLTNSVLYGEMHNAVTLTSDLLAAAEKAAKLADAKILPYAKAQIKRMEYLAERTPGMIENWNPSTGYPEFDNFGFLTTFYRQSTVTHQDIIRRFGMELPSTSGRGLTAPVVLESYWDDVYTWYWVGSTVLSFGEHKLPRIPINVQITDGSRLFDKPEEQRQPLLYGFIKSGMFDNQSLALSVLFNLVFSMGVTPIIKHRHNGDGKKADSIINFDVDGGAWEIGPGEEIEYMVKNIIDPSLREALGLATQKGQESTIYPQAFGAPVTGTHTFSEMALLNTSGRLPLIGSQKRGSWGISNTMELLLLLMKENGTSYKKNGIEINVSEIPDNIQIDTKLEVDLPQDKLQLSNMATILKRNGLASDEWIQTNILQMTDTAGMRKQIWKEKVQEALYSLRTQENIQKLQARNQPPNANPAEANQALLNAPTEPGMEGGDQMMTSGPMMPEGGEALQGMPQAMAGMMPGAGRAVAPPQGQINGRPPKARAR